MRPVFPFPLSFEAGKSRRAHIRILRARSADCQAVLPRPDGISEQVPPGPEFPRRNPPGFTETRLAGGLQRDKAGARIVNARARLKRLPDSRRDRDYSVLLAQTRGQDFQ